MRTAVGRKASSLRWRFKCPISRSAPTLSRLPGRIQTRRHLKWLAVGLPARTNVVALSALLASETINRVSLAFETAQHASALMHPGSTLVITDQPSHQGHANGTRLYQHHA